MRQWMRNIYINTGYKAFAIALALLTGLILYAFLYSSVKSDTYNPQLFQLSEETIRSAKTVEDPVKTEQERERAAAEVSPSYHFNDEIAGNQAAVIESLFGYVQEAKEMADQEDGADMSMMVTELQENLRLMETSENGLRLTDEMLRALLSIPDGAIENVQEELTEIVESRLGNPIREEQLSNARNGVEQEVRESDKIPSSVLQAAVSIVRFGLIPNETVNEELTKAQAEQARASIEPTRILKGQVLVQEGQVIDKEIYRQLELAGMTEEQTTLKPLAGLGLFVLLAMLLLLLVTQRYESKERNKRLALMVIALVLVISLALMQLISAVSDNFDTVIAFLFPTAMAGMIMRLLTNERLAVLVTFLIAASAGMMLEGGYAATLQMDIALYILFGGLTGIYLIEQDDRRLQLLQTSLAVAIVNVLFIGFYILVGQSQYDWSEIAFYLTAAVVSGLLSGALTIGLLPFFETAFGLLSTMRLIELSNPNHPLLKKILTETPGTYHHSVMVANLADAACEAVGANGLLARVGCYYHDIGKTELPQYFIENQFNGANPHDSLPPEESRDIILAHGRRGAEMLREYKMPKEIVDIAAQHHGTSLLKYFYHKAKERNPAVAEQSYRYEGPKPQTKEIAIICIADSLEAAVRSMKEPTTEKIKNLVAAIIEDKLKDGQFDECDLTMKELKKIKAIMCETLNGIFHSRIEYPKEQIDGRKQHAFD
ncbi:HD family phosphohydrolase [Planococcus salinus]|uniref:HD family phosphohydrolase n=1 Tax=Planococcus salinus TaxID=1848460 RepID=A0A3M8PBC9_9BACL|nr:HD family phosphohydrolase [Planococcus salinus]RNF41018.1 HD family phosphohydrolase [Planococcus salinus]